MKPAFNLLDESWVPVIMKTGDTRRIGIRDTILRSREISEIFDPSSPINTLGVIRTLMAICYRAFRPLDEDKWSDIWAKGAFPAFDLNTYLQSVYDSFFMIHPERPFWQDQRAETNGMNSPVTRLSISYAYGNNATLSDYTRDQDRPPIALGDAALMLIGHQTMDNSRLGGGSGKSKKASYPRTPLSSVATTIRGRNLFETMMLNLIPLDLVSGLPLPVNGAEDLPVWERTPQHGKTHLTPAYRECTGYIDILTWRSRGIFLVGDETHATTCYYDHGETMPKEVLNDFIDPMASYHTMKKKRLPIKLRPNRALWRDLPTLAWVKPQGEPRRGALALQHVFRLIHKDQLPLSTIRLDAYGVATDPVIAAKILSWRHERMVLPSSILADDALFIRADAAAALAEAIYWKVLFPTVKTLRWTLSPIPPSKKDKKRKPPAAFVLDAIERSYWRSLRSLYTHYLDMVDQELPNADDNWKTILENTARGAWGEGYRLAGNNGKALRAISTAQSVFERRLPTVLAGEDVPETKNESTEKEVIDGNSE